VASLVLGITSIAGLAFFGILGVPLGILAIIVGRHSLKKVASSDGALGGRDLALAGIICGIVGTVLGTMLLVVGVLLWLGLNGYTF